MAGPELNPWLAFLEWLEKFLKENWSGLAVLLYDYEEKKIDAAKQEQITAQLNEKLATDENTIRKAASVKSDDDIIREQLGLGPKPKS
jgi:hypothetical protein